MTAGPGFRVLGIDHLGIAVRSLEQKIPVYEALGLSPAGREVVDGQKVEVCFLPVGESNVELLEPTAPDSPVAKFLDSRGEGIHHVCYRVDDLAAALRSLRERGIPLIHETPVEGAHGAKVAFLHPKGTGGVLVELKEVAGAGSSHAG